MTTLQPSRATRVLPITLLFAMLLAVPSALAGDDAKFDVKMMSIRATKSDSEVSPELKSLADQLKKETKLTGFKLEKSGGGSTEKNKDATLDTGKGYRVKVTPIEKKDDRVTLQVEIFKRGGKGKDKDKDTGKERSIINTKVTLDSGKTQLWALDYPDSDADKLIIAVRAK